MQFLGHPFIYMAKIEYKKEYKDSADNLLPGVTTVLKNLGWNKDILMAWAASVTKKGGNYKDISKDASETGTLAHSMAEAWLNGQELSKEIVMAYDEDQIVKATNAVESLKIWQEGSKLKIIGTEVMLISDEYGYGGTADVLFENGEGQLEIGDVKTSGGTYADYVLQLAAYAMAAEETFKRPVVRTHILRFGKNKSASFHHSSWGKGDIDTAFDVFRHLVAIHNLKDMVEGML